MNYKVGVLVISDSCFKNEAVDTSGVNLKEILSKQFDVFQYSIVPDEIKSIRDVLIDWCDNQKLDFIVTTGGTGLSPRDVTPEATRDILDREISSIPNTVLIESLKITKFATLSRAIAGTRKKTLIVNLPGSKKGSEECLNIIMSIIPHSLNLICEKTEEIRVDHVKIQQNQQNNHACSHNLCSKSSVTDQYMLSKPRQSIYPMISIKEALEKILEQSNSFEIEEKSFLNSFGYVSACEIRAEHPLPHFRASVKDGFALKLPKDYQSNTTLVLNVVGTSNAGDTKNLLLKEGECVKINTGAYVPECCDAVIQIEDTVSLGKNTLGEDTQIKIQNSNIQVGQDIRAIGSDIAVNEVIVREKSIIGPAQIGCCATVGALKLKVFKKPIVGILSTGNELMDPSIEKLEHGKIRDSNKSLLQFACKRLGIESVIDLGVANDNSDSVLERFKEGLEKADIIVSTGGVSMSDKDMVKDVLVKDLKCELHFARLNMKPGKPTTFMTVDYKGRKKLLFCLPGNPVSAIVTFNLLVIPSLKKIMGHENPNHTRIQVQLDFDADLDPRPEYYRSLLEWSLDSPYPLAKSTGNQHSSRLLSMNQANCLVELPGRTVEKKCVKKGELCTALIIDRI